MSSIQSFANEWVVNSFKMYSLFEYIPCVGKKISWLFESALFWKLKDLKVKNETNADLRKFSYIAYGSQGRSNGQETSKAMCVDFVESFQREKAKGQTAFDSIRAIRNRFLTSSQEFIESEREFPAPKDLGITAMQFGNHWTVLIEEDDNNFFYDPNQGTIQIDDPAPQNIIYFFLNKNQIDHVLQL